MNTELTPEDVSTVLTAMQTRGDVWNINLGGLPQPGNPIQNIPMQDVAQRRSIYIGLGLLFVLVMITVLFSLKK